MFFMGNYFFCNTCILMIYSKKPGHTHFLKPLLVCNNKNMLPV